MRTTGWPPCSKVALHCVTVDLPTVSRHMMVVACFSLAEYQATIQGMAFDIPQNLQEMVQGKHRGIQPNPTAASGVI